MHLAARIEPVPDPLPTIRYRWDAETEILSGRFRPASGASGLTGSVDLEGAEGAFLVMDVQAGIVCGVEVVVWPEVEILDPLVPPSGMPTGRVVVPARASQPGIGAVELDATLVCFAGPDRSVFHFVAGPERAVRPVQVADHLILEVDDDGQLAGVWLTAVPAFPEPADG